MGSLVDGDVSDLEDAVFRVGRSCSLCIVHGVKSLTKRSLAAPKEVLSRLRRFATGLNLTLICITPRKWHTLVDADMCIRMKAYHKDEYTFSVRTVSSRMRHLA